MLQYTKREYNVKRHLKMILPHSWLMLFVEFNGNLFYFNVIVVNHKMLDVVINSTAYLRMSFLAQSLSIWALLLYSIAFSFFLEESSGKSCLFITILSHEKYLEFSFTHALLFTQFSHEFLYFVIYRTIRRSSHCLVLFCIPTGLLSFQSRTFKTCPF